MAAVSLTVRPGVRWAISSAVNTPKSLIWSPVKALMVIPTSLALCTRFYAVTRTSSSCAWAWLLAVQARLAARTAARIAVCLKRGLRELIAVYCMADLR